MNDQTINLVSMALDAALMRQTAIATNIANINTQNYQTLGVNFEEQLNSLTNLEDLQQITPSFQLSNEVNALDTQMAHNLQNTTQYRALLKGLNEHLALYKIAMAGNNAS